MRKVSQQTLEALWKVKWGKFELGLDMENFVRWWWGHWVYETTRRGNAQALSECTDQTSVAAVDGSLKIRGWCVTCGPLVWGEMQSCDVIVIDKYTLYHFITFKYTEACFMIKHLVYRGECSRYLRRMYILFWVECSIDVC